jgi:hypothetical protein
MFTLIVLVEQLENTRQNENDIFLLLQETQWLRGNKSEKNFGYLITKTFLLCSGICAFIIMSTK